MTAKCALMTNTKIGQAMNQCPLPKSYTLQLFNDKKYNYVNAWNLGLMAKMAKGVPLELLKQDDSHQIPATLQS